MSLCLTTGDVNHDHLVQIGFASFLTLKLVFFPFVRNVLGETL